MLPTYSRLTLTHADGEPLTLGVGPSYINVVSKSAEVTVQ